jgi:hypothetical protein
MTGVASPPRGLQRALGALILSRAVAPSLALAEPGAERVDAAAVAPIGVAWPECSTPPYERAELRDGLDLELAQRHFRSLPGDAPPPLATLRIELSSCDRSAEHLVLLLRDTRGALVGRQQAALRETPYEARARTLALWMAESLEARRGELFEPPPAAAESPPLRAAAEPSPDAPSEPSPGDHFERALHLGLGVQARSPLHPFAGFWGAEITLGGPLRGVVAWTGELALAVHASRTPLGELQATWLSGAVGVDWTWRGRIGLGVGPRLSLAHVSAHGENQLGESSIAQNEYLTLLGARARIDLALGGSLALYATLDAAHPLRGLVLTAGGVPQLWLDG